MSLKIKDVAKIANVSTATVSRVINNSNLVSKQTRAAVLKAVKKTGYTVNLLGRHLRQRKSNVIVVMVHGLYPNPFAAKLTFEIEKKAFRKGIEVIVLDCMGKAQEERKNIQNALAKLPPAILIIGCISRSNIKRAFLNNTKIICLERKSSVNGVINILVDQEYGSKLAVNYLISHGHKRIGFIGSREISRINKMSINDKSVEEQRYCGYMEGIKEAGLTLDKRLVKLDDYTIQSGYHLTKSLLKLKKGITAIFAASDIIACGTLQCLYDKGIKVPGDIEIVGYDNTYASYLAPPIPSIDLMYEEMAEKAVKWAFCDSEKKETVLKPRMVIPVKK